MKLSTLIVGILLVLYWNSSACADAVWNESYDPPKQIKIQEDINYRSGPGTQYSKMNVVKKGSVLSATAIKDGWYEIPLEGGGFGYIYKRFVIQVDQSEKSP